MARFISSAWLLLALWPATLSMAAPPAARGPSDAAGVELFEKEIRPLLAKHCYKCHSKRAKKLRGGLLLDSRAAALDGGDSGPAIVPGSPDTSPLIEAVRYENDSLQMPPAGKLAEHEIAQLIRWVKIGAPAPSEPVAPATDQESTQQSIDPAEARSFWSFQPPKRSTPPAVGDPAWVERPIDAFVLSQLEEHGLSPSDRADRRTLIRRATLDLVGLPPTPEQIDAFVNDTEPAAYARLIDRLLASPHHGERWGRHWLDVARYTDATASWLSSKREAYRYRDWVVRAFNDDVPYDEFIKRQLATDLMPQTGPDDLPALGFLGLSPTYWKELKLAPSVIKTIVADEWEERIDAVSRSFLGLTVSCARCHDHKFDPISMQDYYALAGVFASTRLADRAMIAGDEASSVERAQREVRPLAEELKKLKARKSITPAAQREIEEIGRRIGRLKKTPHYDAPTAHAVAEASLFILPDGPNRTKLVYREGQARDLPVFIRGSPNSPDGSVVPRRFLAVLSPDGPVLFGGGSGRLELARAIVDEGMPLAARVMVNRVWTWHFGRGLVDTPSNFGSQGARPSHPRLLDDLAARLIDHGWSIKWLHREIMLSSTYRQAGTYDETKQQLDPDNRWLWHADRRRLDVEAWRDAMLAVSGELDRSMGGPSRKLREPGNRRRTIYGTVERRELDDLLRLYDFPDPAFHSPGRSVTTTPLQQLFVLNSDFVQHQSAALARRLASNPSGVEGRVQLAYRLLYGRRADEEEVRLARGFLSGADSDPQGSQRLWSQYCQVLLGSSEFIFVD